MFTIADHSFRKLSRFTKEDRCVSCNNPMDAIVTQGYKCSGEFTTLQIYPLSSPRRTLGDFVLFEQIVNSCSTQHASKTEACC